MASSPLTMALLGGQQQDPLYAPAQRKLALGQQFAAEGTSAAPAYPMQALARVLQAGLGGYLMYSGDRDFQDATKQRQTDTTNAIQYMRGPQSPLVSAMLPPAQPEMPPRQAPPDIAPIIQQASAKSGVPEGQLTASLAKESGFDPNAVNAQSGAGGMPQILASTAQQPGYGVQPMAPEDRFKPEKAIPFAADYVAARAKAAGLDMNNPEQAAKAWSLYGGDSSGKYGNAVVAQAGGATGAAPGQPQTGLNAPMVRQAMEMMQRAQEMAAKEPYNVAIQHAAAAQIEQAKVMMGLDQFTPSTQNGMPGQLNQRTNEFKPLFTASPRMTTGPHGEVIAIGPDQQPHVIASNPSGITGSTPESNAMRTIAELGAKIQSGTATPQEQANYATAYEQYVQPAIHVDPSSQQLVRINAREAPAGFPPPPALGGGHAPAPTAPAAVPLTTGGRGPAAAQAITQAQGEGDVKALAEEAAKVMQGHGALGTSATIRATAPQVTTGMGADARLKAAQIFTALGIDPKTAQEWVGTNAAPGEILQKKLFELSTGAVRGMGAREPGSVISMFQKNYPNMSSRDMTIDAMTRLLDMDQTYKEDEIRSRGQHLGGAVQDVAAGRPYAGLSNYQPPEPRIYQAAALAAGGMPFSVWTSGLQPDQQTAALKLAARVYPDASALDAKGTRHTFQPPRGPGG